MANKVEIKNRVRQQVIGMFDMEDNDNFIQVDSGSFVIQLEDYDNGKNFVEVKFIVKNDEYDLEDAKIAYLEKVQKALERDQAKAEKVAKALAKKEKDAKQ